MVFFTRLGVAPELSESAETSPPPDRARSTGAALEAHYRFVVWLVPTLERFPRSQKFLLGDRMQHTALDVLERLIEATYTRRRGGQLALANIASRSCASYAGWRTTCTTWMRAALVAWSTRSSGRAGRLGAEGARLWRALPDVTP